jgi:hypothetical protein
MDITLSESRGSTDSIINPESYEVLIQSDTQLFSIPLSWRAEVEPEMTPRKEAPPPFKGIRISTKPDKSSPG